MITALRDYQQDLYTASRNALIKNKSVCVQLPTGAGKTPIVAAMCESVNNKNKKAWVVVNRDELITQSSNHLKKWNVPHGKITSNTQESRAFNIHVVSKDTLIRRYDRIKNWPDLLIFDECHLYLDRQIEIASHLDDRAKIIGMTATPERSDGRGLSVKAGGLYDSLLEGPSIPSLTADGFLTPLRYFSPPIIGLENLRTRGEDYDEEELEELLERRKIYGELVGHYEKYGKGKAALIFCRSVKSAYHTAERFRDKGFKFYAINGSSKEFPMTSAKRKELIDALTKGDIDGLTNCDLCTYGLDVPRVEYGASIRPTLSKALYFQMIGRILRPFSIYEKMQNKDGQWVDDLSRLIYKKEDALFFDHVNMCLEHCEEDYPGIPPHYAPHIKWNFDGTEKRKKYKCPECRHLTETGYCPYRKKRMDEYVTRCSDFQKRSNVILCPHLDFMYCPNPHCATCASNPDKNVVDARQPMLVIDTNLIEVTPPVPMKERPIEEQREIQDRIGSAVLSYQKAEETGNIDPGAIGELIKIADSLGHHIMWVYHKFTPTNRKTINIPLLHEIARQKNYHGYWIKNQIEFLRKSHGTEE